MVDKDAVKTKLLEIGDALIFTAILAVVSAICIYFDILLALPAFLASAFFIYVVQESKYSKFKNTVGGWVTAVAVGVIAATVLKIPAIAFVPEGLLDLIISAFAATSIMILIGMEHPPAVAILVWFTFAPFSSTGAIGIAICLGIILGVQGAITKMASNSRMDLGEDLTMGPDEEDKDLKI